jgi:DNA (cytosine-5)-methyltransferase 1
MGKKFQFPEPTHCNQAEGTIDLFNREKKPYTSVWDAIGELPPADEPSETALRVSKTIKERIVKHGY